MLSEVFFTVVFVIQIDQAQCESQLKFHFTKPILRDQTIAESNLSKSRINRSPRVQDSYSLSRQNAAPFSPYNRYTPVRDTYSYPTDYQQYNFKTVPRSNKEEIDFWPTPMQRHVEHNPKELPKMFRLNSKPISQDRRPLPVQKPYKSPSPYQDDEELNSWRHTTRLKDRPSHQSGFYRDEDGTYRLPGPPAQVPQFRHLVAQDRPLKRPPNVQVFYDHEERARPFKQNQRETELSLAIAEFVHQHFAGLNERPFDRQSSDISNFSEVEVYVRFIDRRKRQIQGSF